MQRAAVIERVRSGPTWDLAILGGGATGLGIALDAALRGYRAVLLEARDFAHGTSGRSTKLIHGGVRYLARGEFGLVREALRERGNLLRNASHLVRPLSFVIPARRLGAASWYGLGLRLYDRLGGRSGLGASRVVSAREALEMAPTIRPRGLRGAAVYWDAQFDDARLAVALLRSTLDAGGSAVNYARAVALIKEGGRVRGVVARDGETGEELPVRARVVVNASGVFADAIRLLDDLSAAPLLRPSRGSHLVLPRRVLPGESAVLIPKTDDGRVLFAIPWQGRVLLGTTDAAVERVEEDPRPSEDEESYLIEHATRHLAASIAPGDVTGRFAGLRPLLGGSSGSTGRLSREHAVSVSPSGLVTVTGGKWTTYRVMARDALDRAAEVAGLPPRPCRTEAHPLRGAGDGPVSGPLGPYGTDASAVAALAAERPEWSRPLVAGLGHVEAEAVYAARFEMARTVEDVLSRRTRCLVLEEAASLLAAPRVAEILAGELGRDRAWQAGQVEALGRAAGRG